MIALPRGSCLLGFWLALTGAGFFALFAMFGPHPLSLFAAQAHLERHVAKALAAKGFPLEVHMDGQRARLEGAVGSVQAREAARRAALQAAGPGNPYLGGVTSVDVSKVIVARAAAPFVWSASLTPDALLLEGYAPSARARETLLAAANAEFKGRQVRDKMTYAVGAPEGDWVGVARSALAALADLRFGWARLEDERLAILGEGDQASVAAVRASYARSLPQPFTLASLDLTVQGEGLGIAELQGADLADPTAEDCQTAFAIRMRRSTILFETDSASIDPQSRALLDDLAKIARHCQRFSIAIAGYTDATGDAVSNVALSQDRADAVRDYLIQAGVPSERLSSQGFGAANPVAANTTEKNRALNRRIEFQVR